MEITGVEPSCLIDPQWHYTINFIESQLLFLFLFRPKGLSKYAKNTILPTSNSDSLK